MDFPLFTWLIACLGFFFGFFPLIAESQQKVNPPPPNVLHPPPHPHPHPPPLPPPPPPSPFVTIPPPQTPPPPSPVLPAPPSPPESQWLPHPSPRPPIPPSKKRLRPPPNDAISKHRDHNHQYSLKNSTRTKPNNLNEGKKIGLIFVGVVAILQVCVVAILWIRRRQILNANGDY